MTAPSARSAAAWLPLFFVLPLGLVLLAWFVWPLLGSFAGSVHPFTPAGIDWSRWTLENYRKLGDPYYLGVLGRTLRVSALISLITAVLAYPVAHFIAARRGRTQALLLLVYVAPWLVNVAVKAFGWMLLLGPNGLVNRGLKTIGAIDAPLALVFNETGIVIGLVHGHFMFVLLPLWAALSGLDPNLAAAAGNLGARRGQIFRRIVFPLTLPALLAGVIINFCMNMAAFATPALLGGTRARVISYVAYDVNLVELNWPLGAAMAMALLAVTIALVWLSQRMTASGRRRVVFEGAR
ncbi:MAG: ABC transporter permease [Candidatus Rokubacteria bacterium]|nr:ABC transporter permease [Candidatus Rokubacteria bacterium]